MDAIDAQGHGQGVEIGVFPEAGPEFEIAVLKSFLKEVAAGLVPESSPPEYAFLGNPASAPVGMPAEIASGEEQPLPESLHLGPLDHPAVGVASEAGAGEPIDFGTIPKDFSDGPQGAGEIEIVGIEPGHDLAVGAGQAVMEHGAESAIGLGDDLAEMGTVFFENGWAAIGAGVLHDDVLEVGVALAENGEEGFFEVGLLVVAGGDDGDPGP